MDATRDEAATEAELDRLRPAVLADAALSTALGELWRPDIFAEQLADAAAAHGARLGAADVKQLLQSRRRIAALAGAPPPGWLPAQVTGYPGAPAVVRWAWLGERRLAEPAYAESVGAALSLPFSRLFGFETPLADLKSPPQALPPAGFIFHMSRCGSTLVAQMLAASAANVVVAEAQPIDAVLRLDAGAAGLDAAGHVALVRAMVLACGHARRADVRRSFVKLDSWHIRAAPLIRAAFPQTPWVFLCRDPVEVMVSQMRSPGMQMSPDQVPPAFLGIGARAEDAPPEDYVARVLAAICTAAAAAHQGGGGLVVDYDELPGALSARILPHFGATASSDEIAVMEAAAKSDAKDPTGGAFAPDGPAKRAAATDAIRAAVTRHLAEPCARLEALRRSA